MENILNDLRDVFKSIESIQSKLVRSEDIEGAAELECLEHLHNSMRSVMRANKKISNVVDRWNFVSITTTYKVAGVYIKPAP